MLKAFAFICSFLAIIFIIIDANNSYNSGVFTTITVADILNYFKNYTHNNINYTHNNIFMHLPASILFATISLVSYIFIYFRNQKFLMTRYY